MSFIQRMLLALMRWMQGRYRQVDALNMGLLIVYIILAIVGTFVSSIYLRIAMLLPVLVFLFRYFSKNIPARLKENNKFSALIAPLHLQQFFSGITRWGKSRFGRYGRTKLDPNYHYFPCPYCRKALRVPKGHGKIRVTCPICKSQFYKDT